MVPGSAGWMPVHAPRPHNKACPLRHNSHRACLSRPTISPPPWKWTMHVRWSGRPDHRWDETPVRTRTKRQTPRTSVRAEGARMLPGRPRCVADARPMRMWGVFFGRFIPFICSSLEVYCFRFLEVDKLPSSLSKSHTSG